MFFILAALLTVLLFLRSLNMEMVWEDRRNLLENTGWRGFSPAWWFTSVIGGDFKPLVWASYAWDHTLWGLNPTGYHLSNIILHGLNAALLFALIRRLTGAGWRTALIAVLFFSFHPLRVEAVSWITARKETLFAFFYLASVLAWLNFRRRTGPYRSWYLFSVVLAFLSFLSKPMSVSLPAVLILLDFFRRDNRSGRLPFTVSDKIPYLAGALAVTFAAFYGQIKSGSIATVSGLPITARIPLAARSAAFYLEKTILPLKLFPIYELSPADLKPKPLLTILCLILLPAITYGCVAAYRKGLKTVLQGLLWFPLTWIPVSGLFQTGLVAWADRFSYLPAMGFSLALAAALNKPRLRKSVLAASAVALTALAALTWRQQGFWNDENLMFGRLFELRASSMAQNYLGTILIEAGRIDEAVEILRSSVETWPNNALGHLNLANALVARGETASAVEHYRKSLELDPRSGLAYGNLALILMKQGLREEAEKNFLQAIELAPGQMEFHVNLGTLQMQRGNLAGAEKNYRQALRLDPSSAVARYNLGLTLENRGKKEEAAVEYRLALKANPGLVEAHLKLALILLESGDKETARAQLKKAIQLRPGFLPAISALERLEEGRP